VKKVKDLLTTKEFTLGTHLPVLHSVLEVFKPKGIMELGAGLRSTPFLYNYENLLISIESNLEWLKKVEPYVPLRDKFKFIYHNIGYGIHAKTKYKQIPSEVSKECINFYFSFIEKYDLDFLFIDHVSGLRVTALIELFNNFLIVAYHDAQHPGYYYEKFLEINSSDYLHFMFESLGVYTGILIHNKYAEKIEMFNNALKKYGKKYCKDLDVIYEHILREVK